MTSDAVREPAPQPQYVRPAKGEMAGSRTGPAHEVDFTFDDLIDTLNPLQHIPVVSTIYRALTGDEIAPHAQMMGSVLYAGGATGALGGLANEIARRDGGGDFGEIAMAMATGRPLQDRAALQGQLADGGARPPAADAPARDQAAGTKQTPGPGGPDPRSPGPAAPDGGAPASARASAGQLADEVHGNAALQALMADLNQGGGPTGPDARTAARAAAGQASGVETPPPAGRASDPATAAAAGAPAAERERGPGPRGQQQAAVPDSFMPIRDSHVIVGTRARTTAAALRAEADLMGSRRLQTDAPSRAVPRPGGPDTGEDDGDRSARDRGRVAEPAPDRAADPAPTGPTRFAQPPTDRPATAGDFAERMMRALDKYERMHER